MAMDKFMNLFVMGLLFTILGALIIIFSYAMVPSVIIAQNNLQCATTSGVTLTAQQNSLVNTFGNINIMIMLIVGVIVLVAGIAMLIYKAFEEAK
jgi:uncharacterized membrane protein